MLGELTTDEKHDLAAQQCLRFGILGVGIAAGAAIGLSQLQSACIADGVLPKPGAEVSQQAMYTATACWESAVLLQQIANYSGIIAAVLLLAGAALDQYPEKVQEVIPS